MYKQLKQDVNQFQTTTLPLHLGYFLVGFFEPEFLNPRVAIFIFGGSRRCYVIHDVHEPWPLEAVIRLNFGPRRAPSTLDRVTMRRAASLTGNVSRKWQKGYVTDAPNSEDVQNMGLSVSIICLS